MGIAPEGFVYVSDFLSPPEQGVLLRELQGLDYEHDTFRGQRLKRSSAQFGYRYIATGRKLDPAPSIPDSLVSLIKRALPYCPERTQFNQCLITHYPLGAGIGWHVDAPRFGECIMAISLGADARLQFRPPGSKNVSYGLRVVPGSLSVMHGPARWEYQHQVIPAKAVRYSLTFRQVADPQ